MGGDGAQASQRPSPEQEPKKEQIKQAPLTLSYKIVFAPFSVSQMEKTYHDAPRDGKWHLKTNLIRKEGNTNNKHDELIFFDFSDLHFNAKKGLITDSVDDLLSYVDKAIERIKAYLKKRMMSSVAPGGDYSSEEGKVKISIAAYAPMMLFANALCDIFGYPRINTKNSSHEYQDFYNQLFNYKYEFDEFKNNGWTFQVDYVAMLDLMAVRYETVEEENRRKEQARLKKEAEERAARAKAKEESLSRSSKVIAGIGIFLGVVTTAALMVACPPAGVAIAVSVTMGAGTVAASATLHMAQAKYEEEYLGETNIAKHIGLVLLDAALIVPWGSVVKVLGGATKLGGSAIALHMVDSVGDVVDDMEYVGNLMYQATNFQD